MIEKCFELNGKKATLEQFPGGFSYPVYIVRLLSAGEQVRYTSTVYRSYALRRFNAFVKAIKEG